MFTGIVESVGEVLSLRFRDEESKEGCELTVHDTVVVTKELKLGDSIAVNGVCLTVTKIDLEKSTFDVGLAPETLRRTDLGDLKTGSICNLERCVTPSTRMGGHFVQGHVDGTGVIEQFKPEGDSLWVTVKVAKDIIKYIVVKGYISVDGASLTICDVNEDTFTFMLVAYTQTKIVVPKKKVGDRVNLEVDILGKYVERFLTLNKGDTESPIGALASSLGAAAAASS